MKIREIVSLKEFDPVVNLNWAVDINEQERMLANYIMTEDIAGIFVDMLESFNLIRSDVRREELGGDINSTVKRSHIISGQYGTGKSYFLLMLSVILEMKNQHLADKLIEKFKNFPELYYQLKYIRSNKKYFVVRINGEAENEKEFKDAIQAKVIEALEEKFEDVNITTVYDELIKRLEKAYGRHKIGMDSFLEDKDYDMEDLIASLSNHRKEGIEQSKELLEEVLGFVPHLDRGNLEDFFKNVNQILKSNGYDELVIIFDEFSAFLTASIESRRINIDLGHIQTLAQLSSANSKLNLSFVASIHKDINEILGKNGVSSKQEIDKVFGRFDTHILSFDQGEELLKNTINLDIYSFKSYELRHKDLIETLEKKYHRNFLDFYPLHPATVQYLEPISQLYAQKVRTTFGFLKEVVKEKFFNREVEENGKLNLITLSDLYDYFEESINSRNPEIIAVYNQNYNMLSKDEELVEFLKALTISYSSSLTKSGAAMELSSADLKDIYQLTSEEYIREKLNPIVNSNYSNITVNNGKYRLFVNSSGINIDNLINDAKEKISPDTMLSKILEKAENRIFIKRHYNLKYNMGLYPFDRMLDGEKYTLAELERVNFNRAFSTSKDGKIIFIIPGFNENYDKEKLVKEYSEKMMNCSKNICLAIPESLIFNPEELKEYGAMLYIEKHNEEISKNEELKKALLKRMRKLEDKIRNKYLRKFANLRNFTLLFSEGRVRNDLRQDISLYKEMLYNYYEKFPTEIKVENFNTRAPLNEIVKMFINLGVAEVSKKDTSVGSKQVFMTLEPLGLIKKSEKVGAYSLAFKMPDPAVSPKSKEIMDIILAPEDSEGRMNLKEKYQKLSASPYGLILPLIDLYIYIASKSGKIVIHPKGSEKIISLDTKSLESISKKPEEYTIEINKETSVPVEVKEVWLKLNNLRIVTSSQARKFNPEGRNDFNPYIVLGQEIKTIYNNLKDKEERLSSREVKTGKFKTLVNRLYEIGKKVKPEELYEAVIQLPLIFRKSSFGDNLNEFGNYMQELKELTNNEVIKLESSNEKLNELRYKIKDLNTYSDLKNSLNELEKNMKQYRENFLDLELLNKIAEETENLLRTYNHEFKIRHDKIHEKYNELREKLLKEKNSRIESLKYLKEFKFENIASVEDFLREISDYVPCEVIIAGGKVAGCSICSYDELKKLEGALESLEDRFRNYDRRIVGVFSSYIEELGFLKIKDELKYDESYKMLMFSLNKIENNMETGEENTVIKEKIWLLKDKINSLIEPPPQPKNVDFQEIESRLLLELQSIGQNYVSLDEIKEKFDKIIEEYRAKEFKIAKI